MCNVSQESDTCYKYCFKSIIFYYNFSVFIFSLFFNFFGFWETSLLQGGPALYCRAKLQCTALKGDM